MDNRLTSGPVLELFKAESLCRSGAIETGLEFLLDNGFESYFDEVAHANGRTGLSIGADLLFSRDQSAFKEFSSKYAKYLNSSIVERLEESTSISELSRLLIGGFKLYCKKL